MCIAAAYMRKNKISPLLRKRTLTDNIIRKLPTVDKNYPSSDNITEKQLSENGSGDDRSDNLATSSKTKRHDRSSTDTTNIFRATKSDGKETAHPCQKRKTLPPGFTAKQHVRHFVRHNYHDHGRDPPETFPSKPSGHSPKDNKKPQKESKGTALPFPFRLHAMLEKVRSLGFLDIVSWCPHGRAFTVHDPKSFVTAVMPIFFRQTKLSSFQRQLNLYGFCRITTGRGKGSYYHEYFLRGKPLCSHHMVRIKVKGTGVRTASSPETEPDLFSMPSVLPDEFMGGVYDRIRPNYPLRRNWEFVPKSTLVTNRSPSNGGNAFFSDSRRRMMHSEQPSIKDRSDMTTSYTTTATTKENAMQKNMALLFETVIPDFDIMPFVDLEQQQQVNFSALTPFNVKHTLSTIEEELEDDYGKWSSSILSEELPLIEICNNNEENNKSRRDDDEKSDCFLINNCDKISKGEICWNQLDHFQEALVVEPFVIDDMIDDLDDKFGIFLENICQLDGR